MYQDASWLWRIPLEPGLRFSSSGSPIIAFELDTTNLRACSSE
jgi:hypothetical protein